MGYNWRSCYTGQCAEKEGAVICPDTILGSFQDSLILTFFISITRTLWIWTSIDLGQFFSGTGNVQKRGKKKNCLGELLCLIF